MTPLSSSLTLPQARTLSDETARHLRDGILYGVYAPGARISEEETARALSVSRTCVREAFAVLEAEGLLRRARNRFTEVVRFTPQDAREVMELRAVIEGMSAWACVRARRVPLDAMGQALDGIARAVTRTPVDRRAYLEHDLAFHRALVTASDSRHALRHWSLLEAKIRAMLFLALEELDVTEASTVGLHRELLETLRRAAPDDVRDAEAAERRFREHGVGVVPLLQERLAQQSGGTDVLR